MAIRLLMNAKYIENNLLIRYYSRNRWAIALDCDVRIYIHLTITLY